MANEEQPAIMGGIDPKGLLWFRGHGWRDGWTWQEESQPGKPLGAAGRGKVEFARPDRSLIHHLASRW